MTNLTDKFKNWFEDNADYIEDHGVQSHQIDELLSKIEKEVEKEKAELLEALEDARTILTFINVNNPMLQQVIDNSNIILSKHKG